MESGEVLAIRGGDAGDLRVELEAYLSHDCCDLND